MEKIPGIKGLVFSCRKQLACLMILAMIMSLVQINGRMVQASGSGIYWSDEGVRAEAFGEGQEDVNAKTLKIRTAGELGLFAYNFNHLDETGQKYINDGYVGWTVVLEADIDLSEHYWRPLGSVEKVFSGNFNGNNHTIRGITIIDSSAAEYRGFFGNVWSSSISNLTVEGVINVPAAGITDNYVGGLAGFVVDSSISNCTNNIMITYSLYGNIGGIAAYIRNSTITNCINKADINAYGMQGANVGGIAGQIYSYGGMSAINGCRNFGRVYVNAAVCPGMSSGTICLGGIAGSSANDCVIYDCMNDADVCCSLNQAGTCAGGIIGNSYNAKVMNCQSTGTIVIMENNNPQYTYIGGIAGNSSSASYSDKKGIINCYSRNSVLHSADNDKTCIGGIAGYISNSAINNYFAGSVSASVSGSAIGFLIGCAVQGAYSSEIKYNYYTTDTVSGSAIITVSGAAIGLNQLTDGGGSNAVISVSGSAMKLASGMPGALADIMNQNLNKSDVTNYLSTGCYATKWFVDSSLNGGYLCNLYYGPSVILGSDTTVNAYFRQTDDNSVTDNDTVDIVTSARTPETKFLPADFSIRDGAAAVISGVSVTQIEHDTAAETRLTIQVAKGTEAASVYLWYRDTCVGEVAINKTVNSYWTEKGVRAEAFGTGQEDQTAKTLVIKTAPELGLFTYNINSGNNYNDWTITLDNDISLEGHLWEPAGNTFTDDTGNQVDRPFSGTFNGNGHTITNINIKTSNEGICGFFGIVYDMDADGDTCIKNLSVSGNITTANMNNTITVTGGIAALVGNASVKNCNNYITVTLNEYFVYVGGISGYTNNVSITDCVNYAPVTEEGAVSGYAGGICAVADISEIKNCINYGTVSCNNSFTEDYNVRSIGGIAGITANDVVVDSCINDGNIVTDFASPSEVIIGGIIGSTLGSGIGGTTVLNCQSEGTISAASSSINTELTIGGITGQSASDIYPGVINSYSRSNILINGTVSSIYAGGIAGITYDHLVNNYFAGSITNTAVSTNNCKIGLIAGKAGSDSGDADSHIDEDNDTCYYLRYNYYPETMAGLAVDCIDDLYKDPYNTGTMAVAIPASSVKLAAGTQGAFVDKLNENIKNPLLTNLLPAGHTASVWYTGSTINDGYPNNRYYAKSVTLGTDKEIKVSFKSSDADTVTAKDTIDIITTASTDDVIFTAGDFSIRSGIAADAAALAGVNVTSIKNAVPGNTTLAIQVAKEVAAAGGYLWYGNESVGEVIISKTVAAPTPTPKVTPVPSPTPEVTSKPTAIPTPKVTPKATPEPSKAPTPTPVVAVIEASPGSGTGKDGGITITVPEDKLEKCLSDGSVDEVELNLKLNADKSEGKQDSDDIILDGDILQSAKEAGKDLSVCVKASDGKELYTWTFDTGHNVSSDGKMKDVNLSLKVEKIKDTAAIKKTLGENTAGLVLKFAEEGALPAQAAVRIYVGDQPGVKPGSRIYLYHFNYKANKLETLPYSSEYIVDESGYITVTIVHCSDYVVLLKKADAENVTSLKDQITVSIDRKTLYLDKKENGSARIKVNLPATLELAASLKDNVPQSAIGGVTASYSSSNKKAAAVDKNGQITAVGAGKTVITVKLKLYSGKTKTVKFKITVKNHK